jgi:hypothetical protein
VQCRFTKSPFRKCLVQWALRFKERPGSRTRVALEMLHHRPEKRTTASEGMSAKTVCLLDSITTGVRIT